MAGPAGQTSITAADGYGAIRANGEYGGPNYTSTSNSSGIIQRDDSWVVPVLELVGGVRGVAVVALARWLRKRFNGEITAMIRMAAELLATEDEDVCHSVTTLVGDNWSSGVGELLSAARRL